MGNRIEATLGRGLALTLMVCASLCLSSNTLLCQGTEQLYSDARSLLEEEDFQGASAKLIQAVELAPSAEGYYNLALAYYQTDRLVDAAWALASSDALGGVAASKALRNQLAEEVPPQLQPLASSAASSWWRRMAASYGGDAAAYGAIACWATAFLLLAVFFMMPGKSYRYGFPLALVVLAVVFLQLARTHDSLLYTPLAVVATRTALYSAPSTAVDRIRALPPTTRLTLGELVSDFYAVSLPTGESGWVPQERLRLVLSKEDRSLSRTD